MKIGISMFVLLTFVFPIHIYAYQTKYCDYGEVLISENVKDYVKNPVTQKIVYLLEGDDGQWIEGVGNTETFQKIIWESFVFSPNGQKFAYVARNNRDYFLIDQSGKYGPYDYISDVSFSADSKYITYAIKEEKVYSVMKNGKKIYNYAGVGLPRFSKVGDSFAYVAFNDRKAMVIRDDQEKKLYYTAKDLVYSPVSNDLYYKAKQDEKWIMVRNDTESLLYDDVYLGSLVFSANSSQYAYVARSGMQDIIIHNGEELYRYDIIDKDSLTFSDDGNYLSFQANKDGKNIGVINGQEIGNYDGFSDPVFSAGGVYGFGGDNFVIDNGKKYTGFTNYTKPYYSVDGDTFVYVAHFDDNDAVFFNGEKDIVYPYIQRSSIRSGENDFSLSFFAKKQNRNILVLADCNSLTKKAAFPIVSADKMKNQKIKTSLYLKQIDGGSGFMQRVNSLMLGLSPDEAQDLYKKILFLIKKGEQFNDPAYKNILYKLKYFQAKVAGKIHDDPIILKEIIHEDSQ